MNKDFDEEFKVALATNPRNTENLKKKAICAKDLTGCLSKALAARVRDPEVVILILERSTTVDQTTILNVFNIFPQDKRILDLALEKAQNVDRCLRGVIGVYPVNSWQFQKVLKETTNFEWCLSKALDVLAASCAVLSTTPCTTLCTTLWDLLPFLAEKSNNLDGCLLKAVNLGIKDSLINEIVSKSTNLEGCLSAVVSTLQWDPILFSHIAEKGGDFVLANIIRNIPLTGNLSPGLKLLLDKDPACLCSALTFFEGPEYIPLFREIIARGAFEERDFSIVADSTLDRSTKVEFLTTIASTKGGTNWYLKKALFSFEEVDPKVETLLCILTLQGSDFVGCYERAFEIGVSLPLLEAIARRSKTLEGCLVPTILEFPKAWSLFDVIALVQKDLRLSLIEARDTGALSTPALAEWCFTIAVKRGLGVSEFITEDMEDNVLAEAIQFVSKEEIPILYRATSSKKPFLCKLFFGENFGQDTLVEMFKDEVIDDWTLGVIMSVAGRCSVNTILGCAADPDSFFLKVIGDKGFLKIVVERIGNPEWCIEKVLNSCFEIQHPSVTSATCAPSTPSAPVVHLLPSHKRATHLENLIEVLNNQTFFYDKTPKLLLKFVIDFLNADEIFKHVVFGRYPIWEIELVAPRRKGKKLNVDAKFFRESPNEIQQYLNPFVMNKECFVCLCDFEDCQGVPLDCGHLVHIECKVGTFKCYCGQS